MVPSITDQFASVRKIVSVKITLNIPLFYNLKTKITVKCIDVTTKKQFANIISLKIASMGSNIDGLMNEYNQRLIPTVYSTSVLNASFYKDTAVLDLGIITNTGE